MNTNVLTLGTFDLFHAGHARLLRRCREMAGAFGTVTVGLNTDGFVAAFKPRPPVVDYVSRAEVLLACRFVDIVIPNAQDARGSSAGPSIEIARPQLIVVGSDWQDRDYLGQLGVSQEWLDARGISVVFVPYTQGISSTEIRGRL